MKLQTSKSHIDRIILNSKIFETIKVPENLKRMGEIQKYISRLRNSVNLLDHSKPKEKKKYRNKFHPSRSVVIKDKKEEKGKLIFNYSNKLNRYRITDENKNNNNNNKLITKSRLYNDKLSLLKEKNKTILNKILKNKEKNRHNSDNASNEKMNNSKDTKTFVTSFDFPKIKENNEDSPGIAITELNENNKNVKHRNNKYSLPIIETHSTRGATLVSSNSRNRIKSHIIKTSNSFNMKRKNNKFLTQEEKSNLITIDNQNPINTLDKNKEKEDINKLNKKLISLFGYDYKNPKPSSPEIANFIKRMKKQKTYLNKKNYEYELDKWIMRSKMKYVKWKFGINELEKYFMNIDEYGIKEKNELELRKNFYKKLDLLIDDLKEEREIRRIKEREKVYGIDIKKEEKKVTKDNEYWIDDKALNKMQEQNNFLKMAKERKLKEQKNREIIDNILLKSKQRAYNIQNS